MSEEKPKPKTLQPEVADKYNLEGVKPGTYHFEGFGKIDLTEVDLKRADALALRGFPFLVLKKKESAPAKITGSAQDTASSKA